MIRTVTVQNERLIYYRLIALWVVSETLLGGIIHSFNFPFSSIVLSGGAVICISLMAKVANKGAILKATVIVVTFKFLLSPQTPPAAYLAVFIQGALGELFFSMIRNYKVSCILLGAISLAESALQRIIVLLILFGNDFPKAINKFVQLAFSKNVNIDYSFYIAAAYIFIHLLLGSVIGWFAFSLTGKKSQKINDITVEPVKDFEIQSSYKKKKKKGLLFILWMLLIALLIYSWVYPANKILSAKSVMLMLVRSVIILLTWYLFLSPVVLFYFQKWVKKKQQKMNSDIHEVILLLPSTKYLIQQSWKLSSAAKGVKRILLCCRIIAYNTLLPK